MKHHEFHLRKSASHQIVNRGVKGGVQVVNKRTKTAKKLCNAGFD